MNGGASESRAQIRTGEIDGDVAGTEAVDACGAKGEILIARQSRQVNAVPSRRHDAHGTESISSRRAIEMNGIAAGGVDHGRAGDGKAAGVVAEIEA